jgi:soluble lytic murein transglycosylase-like protein
LARDADEKGESKSKTRAKNLNFFQAVIIFMMCRGVALASSEARTLSVIEALSVNPIDAIALKIKEVTQLQDHSANSQALVQFALGITWLNRDVDRAISHFEEAKLGSHTLSELRVIIDFYVSQGFLKKGEELAARKLLLQLTKHRWGTTWNKLVYESLIETSFRLRRYDDVIKYFKTYREKVPVSRRSQGSLKLLALAYESRGQREKLYETLESMARYYPMTNPSRWAFRKLLTANCTAESSVGAYVFSKKLLLRLSRNTTLDTGLREFVLEQAKGKIRIRAHEFRYLSPIELVDFMFKARLYRDGLHLAEQILDFEARELSSNDRAKLMITLGRINIRLGQPRPALKVFSAFLEEFPRHRLINHVYEYMGDAFKYSSLFAAAAEFYGRASASRNRRYLLWAKFWAYFKGGDSNNAISMLKRRGYVRSIDPEDPEVVDYWLGKLLERNGQLAGSNDAFTDILSKHGSGFYANILSQRFSQSDNPSQADSSGAAVKFDLVDKGQESKGLAAKLLPSRSLKLVSDLISVGLSDPAQILLRKIRWAELRNAESMTNVFKVASTLDDFRPTRNARFFRNSPLSSVPKDIASLTAHQVQYNEQWKIYYPLAFDQILDPVTSALEMDKFLVLSLMRSESFYNVDALSGVGAVGLMQIMPYTGIRLAKRLDDKGFTVEGLRDPVRNIAYGAYYISELVEYYKGQTHLAIAAYNAGPHAVNRWINHCFECAPDEFIDSIPYRETRRYVRRVLKNLTNYRRIYKGEKFYPLPLAEPPKLPLNRDIF